MQDERQKLLTARYAGAVPLDMLKNEMARMTSEMAEAETLVQDGGAVRLGLHKNDLVRERGLEPLRPKTPGPKPGASAIPPLPRAALPSVRAGRRRTAALPPAPARDPDCGRRLADDKPLRSKSRSTRSLSYVTRPSRPHEPLRYRRRPSWSLSVGSAVFGWGGAMNIDRRMRLWSLALEHAHGAPVAVEHVCAAVISATGVDCAAVTVMLSVTPRETVYASDRVASEMEELTLTLGEGPGVDACTGIPALVADLTDPDCLARWPVFAPAAAQAGVRAVFALPLQVGAIRLGVLDLYRARPGDLDRDQLADALMLADTACALLLDAAWEDQPRLDGRRPERAGPDGRRPERAGPQHPEVHQATGMVIAQLGVTAAVALIRLRAYAYSHDRRLRDVAGDVVARRLRFDSDAETGDHRGGR